MRLTAAVFFSLLFLYGCGDAPMSTYAVRLSQEECAQKLDNIVTQGEERVTGVYTGVYSGAYNDREGIRSAVAAANDIINQLHSFSCLGKYEFRRKSAIKVMTDMRDDLKVALEKGMDEFDHAAQETDARYRFYPQKHSFLETVFYDPKIKSTAIGIALLIGVLIALKLFIG